MTEINSDVVVVGGGVAGLAAAAQLAKKRRSVVLLEARDRLGGRILTRRPRGWGREIELGAEFIHEGNPALWRIIREHRLRTRRVVPRHWLFGHDETLKRIDQIEQRIAGVTRRIDPKQIGSRSFADFLWQQLGKLSEDDTALVSGFIEGFEAAPLSAMSARSVAGATLNDQKQFVLPGGYDEVVDAMVQTLLAAGGRAFCGKIVRRITWRSGAATVHVAGAKYVAQAVVVTLPLGVLQAKPSQRGAVRFDPPLRAKEKTIAAMGVGQVTRIAVRFDGRKWKELIPDAMRRGKRTDFGFLHSRLDGVPVWWSLEDDDIVTGWAGGPAAVALAGKTKSEVRDIALGALSRMFGTTQATLRRAVLGCELHNWTKDPFSRGAYSFVRAGHDGAAEDLRAPLQDTLFFAGEATAEGDEVGTVHGAIASGLRAAKEICAHRLGRR